MIIKSLVFKGKKIVGKVMGEEGRVSEFWKLENRDLWIVDLIDVLFFNKSWILGSIEEIWEVVWCYCGIF